MWLCTCCLQAFDGIGSIVRSAGEGAGAVFRTSAIPLAIFTLNRCTAVAPHIHPNSAETLFVLQGKGRRAAASMLLVLCPINVIG